MTHIKKKPAFGVWDQILYALGLGKEIQTKDLTNL